MVRPILVSPGLNVWHLNLMLTGTNTMFDAINKLRKTDHKAFLPIKTKSKESAHFRPHRNFHNSLQNHTLKIRFLCQWPATHSWRQISLHVQARQPIILIIITEHISHVVNHRSSSIGHGAPIVSVYTQANIEY